MGHRAIDTVVLVVDDDAGVQDLVSSVLQLVPGLNTFAASNEKECLELARTVRPDLILLDIELGGLSGLRLARFLRADPTTETIPIIAVTTLPEIEPLLSNFDGHIVRPFQIDELVAKVKLLLQRCDGMAA